MPQIISACSRHGGGHGGNGRPRQIWRLCDVRHHLRLRCGVVPHGPAEQRHRHVLRRRPDRLHHSPLHRQSGEWRHTSADDVTRQLMTSRVSWCQVSAATKNQGEDPSHHKTKVDTDQHFVRLAFYETQKSSTTANHIAGDHFGPWAASLHFRFHMKAYYKKK